MSLGGGGPAEFERNAFQAFFDDGILSIAAAMNAGDDSYSYPASYESIMSVAATDSDNARASFSQYNDAVDIAAPGADILSTVGPPSDTGVGPPGYEAYYGTSMATPHVSGLAMVLWNKHPSYTNADIRTALEEGAQDLGAPGIDNEFGHGLANYQGAGTRLLAPTPPCPLGEVCATGLCSITNGGACATSPNFPDTYPPFEGCTIYNLPPVGLNVIAFDVEGGDPAGGSAPNGIPSKSVAPGHDQTLSGHGRKLSHCESQGLCGYCPECPTCDGTTCETCCESDTPEGPECPYDYLIVNDVRYCGTSGPAGIVPSDGTITWVSDFIVTRPGWKVCAPPCLPAHCPPSSHSPSGAQALTPLSRCAGMNRPSKLYS